MRHSAILCSAILPGLEHSGHRNWRAGDPSPIPHCPARRIGSRRAQLARAGRAITPAGPLLIGDGALAATRPHDAMCNRRWERYDTA